MLKTEIVQIDKDIVETEAKNNKLAGGLVKALIESRLEVLKMNRSLVNQRIGALEGKAKIKIVIPQYKPDLERARKLENEILDLKMKIVDQQAESEKYSGGLIKATIESVIATQGTTLAMLEAEYLKAKYGIYWPPGNQNTVASSTASSKARVRAGSHNSVAKKGKSNPEREIVTISITNKRFDSGRIEDYIWFDARYRGVGLSKGTRAIKGTIVFADLFGEPKMRIGSTVNDPMKVGGEIIENGIGFDYNQFISSHKWLRSTDIKDMTYWFEVESILYEDGSRQEF